MSGSIRLFVPDALSVGATIAPSAAQAHYLGAVMRRGVGDDVRLFNGRDGEWRARIATIRRDKAVLEVAEQVRQQASGTDLWLAFAPLKRDATELVVQKATELGVSAILPVLTERTNTQRLNLDRLRAIAVEAAEQCERLDIPELRAPLPLPTFLGDWPAARALFVAMERREAAWPRGQNGPAGLLIGPEGGFSPRDHDLLLAGEKSTPVSLGPNILRAETAAIAGLALLRARG